MISPCVLVLITLECLMHILKYLWRSGAQDDFSDERINESHVFFSGRLNKYCLKSAIV